MTEHYVYCNGSTHVVQVEYDERYKATIIDSHGKTLGGAFGKSEREAVFLACDQFFDKSAYKAGYLEACRIIEQTHPNGVGALDYFRRKVDYLDTVGGA